MSPQIEAGASLLLFLGFTGMVFCLGMLYQYLSTRTDKGMLYTCLIILCFPTFFFLGLGTSEFAKLKQAQAERRLAELYASQLPTCWPPLASDDGPEEERRLEQIREKKFAQARSLTAHGNPRAEIELILEKFKGNVIHTPPISPSIEIPGIRIYRFRRLSVLIPEGNGHEEMLDDTP